MQARTWGGGGVVYRDSNTPIGSGKTPDYHYYYFACLLAFNRSWRYPVYGKFTQKIDQEKTDKLGVPPPPPPTFSGLARYHGMHACNAQTPPLKKNKILRMPLDLPSVFYNEPIYFVSSPPPPPTRLLNCKLVTPSLTCSTQRYTTPTTK